MGRSDKKTNKISSCTIVYNDIFYIEMMIRNCNNWADEICIVDGYSTDGTWEYLQEEAKRNPKLKIAQEIGAKGFHYRPESHTYDIDEKTLDFGKARQKAYDLSTSDYVFWIDADECLEDTARERLDEIIKNKIDVAHVQYIHLTYDFNKIDSSVPIHYGLVRFHKRVKNLNFEDKTHALSNSNEFKTYSYTLKPIIYHCGYINGMQKIWERYRRNTKLGSFHPPFHQAFWKEDHYRGNYPTKSFNLNQLPFEIKWRFNIGELK
jgi:glycosyltransferase involved in cell wall biosynthesis